MSAWSATAVYCMYIVDFHRMCLVTGCPAACARGQRLTQAHNPAPPPGPLSCHSFAAIPPGTAGLLASQSRTPEQQCRVISNWLNLAVGLLFPLAAFWRLERRARRWHRQRMRQQHAQQQAAGDQP